MKPRLPILAALVGLFCSAHADTILLSDDFSGTSLDPSKWTTILPYGTSSVTQSGGAVTTLGRGVLATANSYFQPYIINGSFTLLNDFEHFNVGFRTDLSFLPDADLYNTLSGMFVSFANDGDQISIQGSGYNEVTQKNYTLLTGQTYFFSIFDDGTEISLAINGVTELTASTTVATGSHAAFYSREFSNTATSLDSVNIVGVPETGAITWGLAVALVGLAVVRRKVVLG